jgi:hypothetical protein
MWIALQRCTWRLATAAMPDPLRLIRSTKNICNVVFAPDQGMGILIAREFLEYPATSETIWKYRFDRAIQLIRFQIEFPDNE